MGKRIFDVVGASLLLITTLPVWLCIALFILCLSKQRIFFRQERLGLHGRPFTILKFETMRDESEIIGCVATKKARRVTPIGRVLRRHHLDELPQLWNVIKGDMSLVGPRPVILEDVKRFRNLPAYTKRLSVRPGITGIVQIRGREWVEKRSFSAIFRLDAFYAQHHCWLLDFCILLKTIPEVVEGRSA